MAKTLSKKEQFGMLLQADWGTDITANANFKEVQWINVGSINPTPGVTIDQFNVTSQRGTHFEGERFFIDSTSGLVTIPFNGTCDKTTLAMFLAAAFGYVVEEATTPYGKTFLPLGTGGVPDWSNNDGILFGLALDRNASADDGILFQRAVIQTLNLVWDVEQSGIAKLVNMNGSFVSTNMAEEQTLNGTWTNTSPSQAGFYNNATQWTTAFNSTNIFTIGGVDYSGECIRRVEFQINNNVRKGCVTTGGRANNYIWAPEYKIMIRIDHNSVTEKIHNDYIQGADIQFQWSNCPVSDGTADGEWAIIAKDLASTVTTVGKLMSPPKSYTEDYITLDLDIRLYQDGQYSPIAMIMGDAIDYGF